MNLCLVDPLKEHQLHCYITAPDKRAAQWLQKSIIFFIYLGSTTVSSPNSNHIFSFLIPFTICKTNRKKVIGRWYRNNIQEGPTQRRPSAANILIKWGVHCIVPMVQKNCKQFYNGPRTSIHIFTSVFYWCFFFYSCSGLSLRPVFRSIVTLPVSLV